MPTPSPAIPVFASDVMVTATQLNAVGSNLTNIYTYAMGGFRTRKPICAVRATATHAVPDSTATILTWDTADLNYDAMWSAGSPTVLTVNTAGVYHLSVQPAHTGTGPNQLAGYILINGTSQTTNAVGAFNVGAGVMGTASALVALTVGTTIYGSIYQATGLPLNERTNLGGCRMVAEWVSP